VLADAQFAEHQLNREMNPCTRTDSSFRTKTKGAGTNAT
jgi:hypothetical protein